MSESMHEHNHLRTKDVLLHIRGATEALKGIELMIENDQPCPEVVNQLTSVISRLFECRNIVVEDHISSCVRSIVTPGQEQVVNEIEGLFRQVLRSPANSGSHH